MIPIPIIRSAVMLGRRSNPAPRFGQLGQAIADEGQPPGSGIDRD
jgi:hypothetical protein